MPRAKATEHSVVATLDRSREAAVRVTPGSVRFESAGRRKERARVVSTAGTFAQTLREVARSKRLIGTDGQGA